MTFATADENEQFAAVEMMERIGGSFARHIARAWFAADSHNKAILETAFADLLTRYLALHRGDKARAYA
ncbi:MAG: hypothetical protein ACK4FJ_18500 [Ferrovibrio sp.]|uniref:hypothetical protein n=1 Tax=Ferrovibrio sp. TaxID=1917215 RepID=UPI00391CD9AC